MYICLFSIAIFLGKECQLSLILNVQPKLLRILSQIIIVLLEIGLLGSGGKPLHDGWCPKISLLCAAHLPWVMLWVSKVNRDIWCLILLFHSISYHFAQFSLFGIGWCTWKSNLQDFINNIRRLNLLVNTLNVIFTKIWKLGCNIL